MIAQIKGKLARKDKNSVLIDVQGICYRVIVPPIILSRIDDALDSDGAVSLVTYHYLQTEPSKSHPVLIGFLNEVERDFFESFITVSGIGPRAAAKAFIQPISYIAQAIDEGNMNFLKSLPGIGMQRAKEIVAKLQGKIGKYGLIQDKITKQEAVLEADWQEEALEVLLQLQYKRTEAKEMIRKALTRSPQISNAEELLNEVYRQKQKIER